MDVVYSDKLPQGLTFELNGILVIGTKVEKIEETEETVRVLEKFAG